LGAACPGLHWNGRVCALESVRVLAAAHTDGLQTVRARISVLGNSRIA